MQKTLLSCMIVLSIITVAVGQTYYRANIFYNNFDEISGVLENSELDIVHHYKTFTKYVDVYLSQGYYEKLKGDGINILLTATTVDERHKNYILGPRWDQTYGYYPKYGTFDSLLSHYEKKYPKIAKRGVLPIKTPQGRDIFYLKVSNSPDENNKKPEICVQGVIHANEPVGAGIVRDGIEYLLENYDKDPEVKWIVDNRQIYYLPVQNVDRYVWNENQATKNERKRRTLDYKNGNPNNSESAGGVDPNRNFPYKWGLNDQGSSPNPTAMNYRGQKPADQKCVQAVIQWFQEHKFKFWNVYHSSGEKVLIPFAYDKNKKLPKNDSIVFYSVYEEFRKDYPEYDGCGPAWEFYFPLNGSTEDWGYHSDDTTSMVYSYITEIGPGTNGGYWFTDQKSEDISKRLMKCDISMAKMAGFYPILKSVRIEDPVSGGGNNDKMLNPGETIKVFASVFNQSAIDTTDVTISLSTSDKNLKVMGSDGAFGSFPRLTTLENKEAPEIKCNSKTPEGTTVTYDVVLSWKKDGASFTKKFTQTLMVGQLVSVGEQAVHTPKSGMLSVAPSGRNQNIAIKLRLPQYQFTANMNVSLGIFTPAGKRVKNLSFSTTSREYSVIWNRQNDQGMAVARGVYFVKIQSKNFTDALKVELK